LICFQNSFRGCYFFYYIQLFHKQFSFLFFWLNCQNELGIPLILKVRVYCQKFHKDTGEDEKWRWRFPRRHSPFALSPCLAAHPVGSVADTHPKNPAPATLILSLINRLAPIKSLPRATPPKCLCAENSSKISARCREWVMNAKNDLSPLTCAHLGYAGERNKYRSEH
jgi:hypothetical protein